VIPLARRHALAALALSAMAAVPILLHQSERARADACLRLQLQHLAAYGEHHVVVEMEGKAEIAAYDVWIEGRLPPFADRRPMFFRVVRTWEPFRFYGDLSRYFYHLQLPENRRELHPVQAGADVLPVHYEIDTTGPLKLTKYFFAVDLEPEEHPFLAGVSRAMDQLLHGRHPVMLFLVSALSKVEAQQAFEEHADSWLASVWSEYKTICRP
jgi:hypothetical protein